MISISVSLVESPMNGSVQPTLVSGPASTGGVVSGPGPQPETPALTRRAPDAAAIRRIAARGSTLTRDIGGLRRARRSGDRRAAGRGSLAGDVVLLRVVVHEGVAVL